MKKIKIVLIILVSVFIVSCESNTYKELELPVPNSTTTISYTANVSSIMTTYCTKCHSVGATSPALTTYDQVRAATETGNVICRIDNTCGSTIMPPDAVMSAGNIATIKLWKTQGFKN